MHNDAVFRGGDDLKVGASAAGNGSVLIDGNAWLSVGSGISVSEGGPNPVEQVMTVAGNALVEMGNSMGAGNPLGSTDEGYLTMAAAVDSTGRLVVMENAVVNYRRLSARQGNSIITVMDHGQMHIFDVLVGRGFIDENTPPDRPAETGPNSTLASHSPSTGVLTLQDDAQMTVNSDPASGPTKGLAISGPRDAGNDGGTAIMIVRDRASFRVEQDLALGTGAGETSDGTLEVVGPSAGVSIGGNLSLAVDLDGVATPGRGTLSAVITGPTHSTVSVEAQARIANGHLKVSLSGYAPASGESYVLINAGSLDGRFRDLDAAAAPLAAGLVWRVDYTATSVVLKVVDSRSWRLIGITGQQGDATPDGQGGYLYPDNTLFEISQTNGAITKLFRPTWIPDSHSIGYCLSNNLLYHSGGAGAYRDNPLQTGHEQGGPDIPGLAFQDNYYLESINLASREMTGILNANPCPNPDSTLPCFGLVAPVPTWMLPTYRRDSSQTDPTNRVRGGRILTLPPLECP
jgi:hypothetical protein